MENQNVHINEVFKNINGYNDRYSVSNFGTIMNIRDGYILKQRRARGYNIVGLYNNIDGKSIIKTFNVHKLVAETFLNNPNNKPCVTHLDKNKLNNCVDNLQYVSRRETQLLKTNIKKKS
jgi:hypothetical protein